MPDLSSYDPVHDLLRNAAFGAFLVALPLSAVHAIVQLALRGSGREGPREADDGVAAATVPEASRGEPPGWLVWFRRGINVVLGLGFLALTASIIARWVEGGYPPFSNLTESLMWMAWGFCGVYFVSRIFRSFPGMELGACLGVLGMLALSGYLADDPRPLMPALQSNWLIFHVLTCMVAYGAFFAAFIMAILWLAMWRRREAGKTVEALAYQTITFGFVLLTVGIVSGAVWARQAWGRYWGWDPKETWSLITWFVYGIYLHFRLVAGSFGVRRQRLPLVTAVFAVVGLGATLFTYFGVSFLLPSLHSYLSGG